MKLPQIPKWKNWLSHLVDQHIVQVDSDYSEYLNLIVSKGRLLLATENAFYSYDDLYNNYFQAFRHTKIAEQKPKNILVLGMGLGSIPFMLEQYFNIQADYTLVEIDPAVIQLASEYSLPRLHSPTEIVQANAAAFMAITDQKFDLIAVDLFIDDVTPSQFEQQDFFNRLYHSLNPSGRLYYNRYAITQELATLSESLFSQFIEPQYSVSEKIQVKTNQILFGIK